MLRKHGSHLVVACLKAWKPALLQGQLHDACVAALDAAFLAASSQVAALSISSNSLLNQPTCSVAHNMHSMH
jgi:hypothetical protein